MASQGELDDLVKAKDYTIGQIARAYLQYGPAWTARDHASMADWENDYRALLKRYNDARDQSHLFSDSRYDDILKALKQDPSTISKGDLQDVYNRIVLAGIPVDVSKTPQPTAADPSLHEFQTLDKVAAGMPNFVKAVAGKVAPDLIPLNKDEAAYHVPIGKSLMSQWWFWAAVAGGLAIVVGPTVVGASLPAAMMVRHLPKFA